MSHFTVLVIGENPEKQLAPFDEQLETPRYVSYTKEQLIEKERQGIQEYAKGMYAEYLSNPEKYKKDCKGNMAHFKYISKEFPLKLKWSDGQLYEEAVKYYKPEDIGENGEVYSENNPNGKWDWYALGGRWAGTFKVKPTADVKPVNFSWGWDEKEKQDVLNDNRADTAIKKDILNLDEVVTHAVIKDGRWYENGEMGWWGVVHDEKDENEWEKEFRQLIDGLPDDTVLSIYDCHV